jgi:hypothetical protein
MGHQYKKPHVLTCRRVRNTSNLPTATGRRKHRFQEKATIISDAYSNSTSSAASGCYGNSKFCSGSAADRLVLEACCGPESRPRPPPMDSKVCSGSAADQLGLEACCGPESRPSSAASGCYGNSKFCSGSAADQLGLEACCGPESRPPPPPADSKVCRESAADQLGLEACCGPESRPSSAVSAAATPSSAVDPPPINSDLEPAAVPRVDL